MLLRNAKLVLIQFSVQLNLGTRQGFAHRAVLFSDFGYFLKFIFLNARHPGLQTQLNTTDGKAVI